MLMRELRNNFGKENEHEVFNSLRHSCKSAYYTPKEVINFMYKYLIEVCKFKGGDILEPSCGNGAFFEYMPDEIKHNSKVTGVEMDRLTSKLVQAIYSDVEIINQPLQDVDFNNRKYDLIIGNPPYGKELIIDNIHSDISNYNVHNYFVARCVRLLKDDGILAFVLPSFYLDAPYKNTRKIVNNEAVLIDVIRLPENLFTQATVTVDIVLIRKSGNKLHDFVNTVELIQEDKKDNINEYWQGKENRILGELKLKWVENYQRYVAACISSDINQVYQKLNNCKFSEETINNYNLLVS
jgi:type I restriction-modification system DNA methylase subunit